MRRARAAVHHDDVGLNRLECRSRPTCKPITGQHVLVVYVGASTAAVFLFRYMAQRSLSPMTVGVYHNLVPVLTIVVACLCFGEQLEGSTIIGGVCIIAGAELVRRGGPLRWIPAAPHTAKGWLASATGARTT